MEITIKNYIERNIPELCDRLSPVFVTDINRLGVAYSFTPISGGHLKQSQLELKIIDADYDLCKEVEEKVNQLLDMEEDMPYTSFEGLYFRSGLSGGGVLFNDGCQRWEDTLYFIIDWRKINVI